MGTNMVGQEMRLLWEATGNDLSIFCAKFLTASYDAGAR